MRTDDDCLPSVPQPHVGQCLVFGVDQGLRVFIVEGSIPKEVLDFVDVRLVFGVAHACIVEGQGLAVERLVEVDKAVPESYLGDDVLEIEGELLS